MILKDKQVVHTSSKMIEAGQKHELQVAFYLEREFGENKDVFVFNDLKIKYRNDTAQIDHLIVYPYGFILIESKSMRGEIEINKRDEWSGKVNGKWVGIPSPIKQVELQMWVLRKLLLENAQHILPKLFGVFQTYFGMRQWDTLCSISSTAVINRKNINSDTDAKLIKAEFLHEKVNSIIYPYRKSLLKRPFFNTKDKLTPEELTKTCNFLLKQNISSSSYAPSFHTKNTSLANENTKLEIVCRQCKSNDKLEPKSGKYGYYVRCNNCFVNTPLRSSCPGCGYKDTKVSKSKYNYTLICNVCDLTSPIDI